MSGTSGAPPAVPDRSPAGPEGPAATAVEAPAAPVAAYLRFRVGTTTLAVPAEQADEIVSVDAVYPIPLAPPHVLGLVAHRGRALPVLDLNEFLGLGEPARSPTLPAAGDLRARLIVVTGAGMSVGIRCDEARGIMELESSELQPAQAAWGERLRACAAAEVVHGGTLIVLLDLPRLLEAARIHE